MTLGGVTRVYLLGGVSSGTLLDTIAVADSMPDGSLGPWVDSAITIGSARRAFDCAAHGDSIYVIGGVEASDASVDECTRIVLDPSTGMPLEAHAETPLPDARGFLRVAFGGFLQ